MPDLKATIESMMARFAEEAEAEASSLGITVEELHAKRRREDEEQKQRERDEKAADRRRHNIAHISSMVAIEDAPRIVDDTCDETAALKRVRGWVKFTGTRANFLVLSGGVGTGKTVAAVWAYMHSPDSEFIAARGLPIAIEPWEKEIERGARAIDLSTRLVVVDDLGTERTSDGRFAEALFELVDTRQGAKSGEPLKTLFTTNLTMEQIVARYGDRIAERLSHCGRFVAIDEPSKRRAANVA